MSVGSQSNDFGTPGVYEHCAFLDSRRQAEKLHQTLLNHHLNAHATNSDAPLNIAVVGAGATGVELCAELQHAARLLQGYGVRKASSDTLKVCKRSMNPTFKALT